MHRRRVLAAPGASPLAGLDREGLSRRSSAPGLTAPARGAWRSPSDYESACRVPVSEAENAIRITTCSRAPRLATAIPPGAAHADVPVVEIPGGVAMAGDEADLVADRGRRIRSAHVHHRVLVGHVARVVYAHRDLRFASERREPFELPLSHDLVAHQHVGHASLHQRLCLAHLLAAHPDRAVGHLPARDHRTLVGLGTRPEPDPVRGGAVRHRFEVALEGVEVDE